MTLSRALRARASTSLLEASRDSFRLEPVKIIYLTVSLPYGADEAFIIPEIHQLQRAGHHVLVVPRSPRGVVLHGCDLLKHSRREPLFSPAVLQAATATALRTPRETVAAIRSLLAGRALSVVIKNLAVVPKAFWLADLAIRWKADHIHSHWAGTTATLAMTASAISGIPWSLTAHRWDIVENNLLAAKARSASLMRFISKDGLRMARSLAIGSVPKASVIHMGAAIPAAVNRRPGPKRVVVCPARLVEVKGHRFLLEAWRILQRSGVDAELWLAGSGELRQELETFASTLGLAGSVRFLGALPHSDLLKIYEQDSVAAVVLASLDFGGGHHEGIPVALIEAMSYAIPVVATAAGGTPELVIPGAGLLVPPADPAALADAIQSLLVDTERNQQLGQAGRERVARHFNIVRVTSTLAAEFAAAARDLTPPPLTAASQF
jgi:colanic acid/amylovoran biosynthesis glycosyltransferase